MTSKAVKAAAWVLSVFSNRNYTTMLTLYKSLIRSHLEYCCPLWILSKITDIQCLEGVQRNFTSRIKGLSHLNYWERLKHLNLMSLQRRRERYVLIFMWKISRQIVPNPGNIAYTYNDRHGIRATVPSPTTSASQAAKSMFYNSFFYLGPALWNCLPKYITLKDTLDTFKSSLDCFLKSIPDNPPISGYSAINHNSILHWNAANIRQMPEAVSSRRR